MMATITEPRRRLPITFRSMVLANGMLNARDKRPVEEVLRILRTKGHCEPPANIHPWAIMNEWQLKAAQELATLASKARALNLQTRSPDSQR